jgi:hypothetical protein
MKNVVLLDAALCGCLRTNLSEALITFIIRVAGIRELGTTLAVASNRSTMRYVHRKHRFLQQPHGVTYQKTELLRKSSPEMRKKTYCLWSQGIIHKEFVPPGHTLQMERYVTVENGVFWDVTPCGSCKNRRFGGT